MYKIFGFERDKRFGRVARVEFSFPLRGDYAYLVGNFNAFNEGSFRMKAREGRWRVELKLPEGLWYYGFSVNGSFSADPENEEIRNYRRISYKFNRTVSLAKIIGEEPVFHEPSITYLYSIGGRIHIILRGRREAVKHVVLTLGDENIPMRPKASDECFNYFEAVIEERKNPLEYSFIVDSKGGTREYGPFRASPYRLDAPEWVLGRVVYQVMPDRFERGLPKGESGKNFHGGDLEGLLRRLDHIKRLGANMLYLTPLFESTTYHGYDIVDYLKVDERLGGDEAFKRLVRELKNGDVKLILDGVFHHTSFFHPFFQDVIEKGEKSEYRDFYRITNFPVVSKEFMEALNSDISEEEKHEKLKKAGWNYESFYSVWLMPRLNHDSLRVKHLIIGVMKYWLERGADGWRLDVAHGVPPSLWKEARQDMPPEVYMVGEVMDDARLWIFDKFHGTMNYPLYELFLRFFVEKEISGAEFLNGLQLLSAYYGPAEYFMYNFLDNHDTERFIDLVKSREQYLCALGFLMTYKGIPALFYGDEIGLRGTLGSGLDAGRTPMEWDREKWDMKILETTRELVWLRRRRKCLQSGAFIPIEFSDERIVYERVYKGEKVRVALERPNNPEKCRLIVSEPQSTGLIIKT
ncbi:alpha amylase N-terminal ig-like domain-containing protein [Thermococcus sp.]